MLKATGKIRTADHLVSQWPSCQGKREIIASRELEDTDTGEKFTIGMYFKSGPGGILSPVDVFAKKDGVKFDADTKDVVYRRVYEQLFRRMYSAMGKRGYHLNEDLTVEFVR